MSAGAVFLSYSSPDAPAARRLAEGLRAAGIEVWFDQNELRGGDAWDKSIRAQIKDCAILVPIISADTNARGEGYFRLEWRLAVERSHLMADDHPFLVPVVIDDTSEATARVPDHFRERQWSRLPGGEPTPEFIAQLKRLLSGDAAAAMAQRRQATRTEPGKRRIHMGGIIAIVAIVAVTVMAIFGNDEDSRGSRSKHAASATKGQYVLCYSEISQSPVYVSGDIHIDDSDAASAVKTQFLAYLKEHYGHQSSSASPAECSAGAKTPAELDDSRHLLYTRLKDDKFIETGWEPSTGTDYPAPAGGRAPLIRSQSMSASSPKKAGCPYLKTAFSY